MLLAVVGGALALPPASPAAAQSPPRTFVEADSVLVHGIYPPRATSCVAGSQPSPLHVRLTGRVEVGKASDGSMFVINELPFETYLEGIAEVPRDWPQAALEAQVIAARTYALGRLGGGDSTADELGYDLCATDACQVYRGLGISHGPWGDRWRAAVAATDRQALVYEGRPASTVYFSTSDGRTRGNEEVFEGAGPLPYLRGVPEEDDGASPVSRWTARIPLSDVARFLERDGEWPGGPIAAIEQDGDSLVIRGGGEKVTMSTTEFRIDVNEHSTCLDPADYPGIDHEEAGGEYRMPQTIPSKWFDARTEDGTFVADGRGWGHGAGMVQWGAHGKAERGLSAADILAYYYGGLRPRRVGSPGTIRVGVATGLTSVTIVADATTLTAKGDRLRGEGPWKIEPGQPLKVTTVKAPPPSLDAEVLAVPEQVRAGERGTIQAEATQGVLARVTLIAGDGSRTELPAERPHHRGDWSQRFVVPSTLPAGDYTIALGMTDGIDTIGRRAAQSTRILAGPVAAPSETPTTVHPPVAAPEATDPGQRPFVLALLIAGILGLAIVLLLVRRSRRPG